MFSNSKVSKSLIDAVSNIISEENKKLLLEPEKKKENKKEVEEGWDDMMKAVKARSGPQPSGGSGVKQGSRYGGSKQKDKPEQDDKMKKEDVGSIDERTLSKGETSEKERIVKGMKKNLMGFKARYGDRAKSVMYATATKAAKNEELVGNQHKIDKNKNGKIDAHDFKLLRKEEQELGEQIGGISTISEKEKEDSILDTKTVDTLTGRKKVPSTFHNQHSDYKVKLTKEEKEEGHEDEKEDKALIKKELDKRLKQNPMLKSLDKNGDGKHTKTDHQKEQVSEGKGTDVDPTFATDANTTNSPLNLARGLAQKSFKKIKNEVMGKTGTSEEKKKW